MKKLGLKVLAITLSVANLLNFAPIKINAAEQQTIPQPKTSDTNSNKNLKEQEFKAIKHLLKCMGIGAVVGAGVGAVVGAAIFEGYDLMCKGRNYNRHMEQIKKEYNKLNFKNCKTIELTECEEGSCWNWLACLQALLKIKEKDFKKTQKELYKEITDKSPGWFKIYY